MKDLAKTMDRDLEHVQEAMLYVKEAPDIHPRTRLDDIQIIKDIVKKCGARIRIVAPPSSKNDEVEKDRDVVKRPPAKPDDLRSRAPVVTVMGHVNMLSIFLKSECILLLIIRWIMEKQHFWTL